MQHPVEKMNQISATLIQVPVEILLKIMKQVELVSGPALFYSTTNSKENDSSRTLFACALVSKQWNAVATEVLWRRPLLDLNNIVAFCSGLVSSVEYDIRTHFSGVLNKETCCELDRLNMIKEKFQQIYSPPNELEAANRMLNIYSEDREIQIINCELSKSTIIKRCGRGPVR